MTQAPAPDRPATGRAAKTVRLADFAGTWRLEREISDFHRAGSGGFSGGAEFAPCPDGLNYSEQGLLQMPGLPALQATQEYLWRADGARFAVFFPDGRRFHSFSACSGDGSASYDCPPDVYQVRYDFADWPEWRATWRVTGPRKDYRMLSHYRR